MKKLLLALPFVFVITACGDPSVEDFLDDPELMGKTAQECIGEKAKGEKDESEKCKNANEAQKKYLNAMLNNAKKSMMESSN